MRPSTRLARIAAVGLTTAMVGLSVIAVAPSASATDYSGYSDVQLQELCLGKGWEISQVPVYQGQEIPTTTVQYGFDGVCGATVQALIDAENPPCATGGGSDELEIDGQDGPLTNAAVICFQKHFGLQANGQVGPITWSWLFAGL
jgi:Putative peptidoglycan binding domain